MEQNPQKILSKPPFSPPHYIQLDESIRLLKSALQEYPRLSYLHFAQYCNYHERYNFKFGYKLEDIEEVSAYEDHIYYDTHSFDLAGKRFKRLSTPTKKNLTFALIEVSWLVAFNLNVIIGLLPNIEYLNINKCDMRPEPDLIHKLLSQFKTEKFELISADYLEKTNWLGKQKVDTRKAKILLIKCYDVDEIKLVFENRVIVLALVPGLIRFSIENDFEEGTGMDMPSSPKPVYPYLEEAIIQVPSFNDCLMKYVVSNFPKTLKKFDLSTTNTKAEDWIRKNDQRTIESFDSIYILKSAITEYANLTYFHFGNYGMYEQTYHIKFGTKLQDLEEGYGPYQSVFHDSPLIDSKRSSKQKITYALIESSRVTMLDLNAIYDIMFDIEYLKLLECNLNKGVGRVMDLRRMKSLRTLVLDIGSLTYQFQYGVVISIEFEKDKLVQWYKWSRKYKSFIQFENFRSRFLSGWSSEATKRKESKKVLVIQCFDVYEINLLLGNYELL
ncbi:hypothetical protein HPULCUR_009636 [Helicostylum pulchrum]|uniref:Uncharacterized protein n=1 Tax=Helicostylum pulchrum TaxID=562976 RepID=A0ABP9YB05_9FUNG